MKALQSKSITKRQSSILTTPRNRTILNLRKKTGSMLLDKYTEEELANLINDIKASSKNKSQSVKDFLLEVRSW